MNVTVKCEFPWGTCDSMPTHRFESIRFSGGFGAFPRVQIASYRVDLCDVHLVDEMKSTEVATDRQIKIQPLDIEPV